MPRDDGREKLAMADEATRSRLGRGLAALIGDVGAETQSVERAARPAATCRSSSLRAEPAQSAAQLFSDAELDELAASMRERGIIQPIVVRPLRGAADAYEIIAGERRWRAAQRAGLHEVPVVVLEATDGEALELAIIENVQRADLNPLEEAEGYQALIDEFNQQPGRHRQDRRQEPQPRRQHAAAAEAARSGEGLYPRRQAHRRARAHAGRPAQRRGAGRRDRRARPQRAPGRGDGARERARAERKEATSRKRARPAKNADTLALEKRLSDALGLASASTIAATAACCRSATAISNSSTTWCSGWCAAAER